MPAKWVSYPELVRRVTAPSGGYDYIIYKEGDYVVAKNGRTGEVEFKGTSGTDDGAIIERALISGKRILLLPGTYYLTKTIAIPSNRYIFGCGVETVITRSGTNYYLDISGVNNVTIENINFQGLNNPSSPEYLMIYLRNNAQNISIRKCRFENFYLSAPYLAPIYIAAASKVKIENNIVKNISGGKGIDMGQSTDSIVKNNYIINVDRSALCFTYTASRVIVKNNFIDSPGERGISAYGDETNGYATHLDIENNVIINAGENGMYLMGPANAPAYYQIIGNHIIAPAGNGIETNNSSYYMILSKNLIDTPGRNGIYLSSAYSVISDNIIINASEIGIKIESVSNCNILSRNIIIGATDWSIAFINYPTPSEYAANCIITENYVDTPMSINGAGHIVKNNKGYITENSGVATFSGDGSTTDFLIGDHGLAVTDPTKIIVKVTPISSDAIAASPVTGYVDPSDPTKIRVKFTNPPASGTNNVQIIWEAQVVW